MLLHQRPRSQPHSFVTFRIICRSFFHALWRNLPGWSCPTRADPVRQPLLIGEAGGHQTDACRARDSLRARPRGGRGRGLLRQIPFKLLRQIILKVTHFMPSSSLTSPSPRTPSRVKITPLAPILSPCPARSARFWGILGRYFLAASAESHHGKPLSRHCSPRADPLPRLHAHLVPPLLVGRRVMRSTWRTRTTVRCPGTAPEPAARGP